LAKTQEGQNILGARLTGANAWNQAQQSLCELCETKQLQKQPPLCQIIRKGNEYIYMYNSLVNAIPVIWRGLCWLLLWMDLALQYACLDAKI